MKKIKIITITLLVILITMVSFFGVYVHTQNKVGNKGRNYEVDIDLNGNFHQFRKEELDND